MPRALSAFALTVLLALNGGAYAQTVVMQVNELNAGGVLNVRTGPGATFEDIGDLQPNDRVAVLGFDPTGEWAQINFRDQLAYVSAQYLSAPAPNAPATSNGLGPHVVSGIPADDPDGGLIARGGAGSNFPNLGVLPNGTNVQVIERVGNGRWAMITYEAGVAWVGSSYLSASAPTPEPTPSAQISAGFPLNMHCRGTEPFWTMDIDPNGTVGYNSLIHGAAPLTTLTQTTGTSPFSFVAAPYSGVIETQQCSDGMSDAVYAMSLALNVPLQSGGMETRYGCCNFVPTGSTALCTTDAECGATEGCMAQTGQCLPSDADNDGYVTHLLGGNDCDDQQFSTNPGAIDVADGIDNDCDGDTDEVTTATPELCTDGVDNSGNGLIDFADPACPTDYDGDGFITIFNGGDDCNDDSATTYPGAPDPLGGPDQNCDGIF